MFSASMKKKQPTETGAQNIGDLFKFCGQGLGNTGFALGRYAMRTLDMMEI